VASKINTRRRNERISGPVSVTGSGRGMADSSSGTGVLLGYFFGLRSARHSPSVTSRTFGLGSHFAHSIGHLAIRSGRGTGLQ
jgi:hypothetical protein